MIYYEEMSSKIQDARLDKSRKISQMWDALPDAEKQTYQKKACQDKIRFEAEIEAEARANSGKRLPTQGKIREKVKQIKQNCKMRIEKMTGSTDDILKDSKKEDYEDSQRTSIP